MNCFVGLSVSASVCDSFVTKAAFIKNKCQKPVMWKQKRKLQAEAAEAAIFYGSRSGSGKDEMNGSGSSKNLPLPPLPLLWYLRQDFCIFRKILRT